MLIYDAETLHCILTPTPQSSLDIKLESIDMELNLSSHTAPQEMLLAPGDLVIWH